MKTKISLCTLIVALALVSCKKELEPQESSTAVRAIETPNTNKTANVTPVQQSTTQAVTTNSTQTTPAGINPPHGQPGHRCDIAVGAPLDSKPNSQTTQVTPTAQPLQIQNQTITATQPVKTAKGMNPPHGQPGHRCDIAVGAPLNSKPNSTTTTKDNGLGMTVTPANVSSDGKVTPQNTTPSLLTTGNSTTEITAPGMNPAHGQPGHRCDIPVGSPLNQEKKSE